MRYTGLYLYSIYCLLMLLRKWVILLFNSLSIYVVQKVMPNKAIKNEKILETLMHQANSGMYRGFDHYIEQCTQVWCTYYSVITDSYYYYCNKQLQFITMLTITIQLQVLRLQYIQLQCNHSRCNYSTYNYSYPWQFVWKV